MALAWPYDLSSAACGAMMVARLPLPLPLPPELMECADGNDGAPCGGLELGHNDGRKRKWRGNSFACDTSGVRHSNGTLDAPNLCDRWMCSGQEGVLLYQSVLVVCVCV